MSSPTTSVLARLRQPVDLRRGSRPLFGGNPQVSLLPAEVREAGAEKVHRRKLIAMVAAAAVVAMAAVLVAQQANMAEQARLTDATRQSQMLAAQLGKFTDVRDLESVIAVGKAGVAVGSSTLIEWKQQIDLIEASMPAGYTVTALTANGATPLAIYTQSDNLLEPRRAATISLTVTAPTVGDEYSAWLSKLRSIPAYADATAETLYDISTSAFTIDLTVHLGKKAISAKAWTER
jgi:hypothetical protein